jgi:hypothetical protein
MTTGIGMGFGGFGIIVIVLFWGGLIFGGIWLVKSLLNAGQGNQSGAEPPGSPLPVSSSTNATPATRSAVKSTSR